MYDESKTGNIVHHHHTVPITGSGISVIASRLMAAPSSPETIERTDLENHEFAQYIFRKHGTYFPKWARADMATLGNAHKSPRLEDMSSLTESIPNLKQRKNQMRTQHTAELEKLYARQAAQYLDDALDRYAAQDDEANGDYSGVIDVCHSQNFRGRTPL